MRIESAGISFGTVLATREVGRFLLRESCYRPNLKVPRHDHGGPYFSLVVRGRIRERDPRGGATYEGGTLHFHPGADPHSGEAGSTEPRCLSIVPRGRLALRLDAHLRPRTVAESRVLAALARRCHGEFGTSDAASDLALEALCLELTSVSLRVAVPSHAAPPAWLAEARDYLHAHLDRRIAMAELAGVAGVHSAHLARVFRRHLGCSPGAYLRGVRIERARLALVSSRAPLAWIALEAGFSSQAHFTRVFHRLVGVSPAAYRRRFQG